MWLTATIGTAAQINQKGDFVLILKPLLLQVRRNYPLSTISYDQAVGQMAQAKPSDEKLRRGSFDLANNVGGRQLHTRNPEGGV
jgi:hypothetical protein